MNRRQKRNLARRIKGYKGILSEASQKAIEEFEEMMQKRWDAETQVQSSEQPVVAAKLNEVIEDDKIKEGKNISNETRNAEGEQNETS